MTKSIILSALVVSAATIVLWQSTGGDYYTKYEVVEEIETQPDENDPLANAGFYEGDTQTEVVSRNEFRFGLLPTPQGLLDKHSFSVSTVMGFTWVLAMGLVWRARTPHKYAHT
jgi:hypothetical protein